MVNDKLVNVDGLIEFNKFNPFENNSKIIKNNENLTSISSIVLGQSTEGSLDNCIMIGNNNLANASVNNIILGSNNNIKQSNSIVLANKESSYSGITLGPIAFSGGTNSMTSSGLGIHSDPYDGWEFYNVKNKFSARCCTLNCAGEELDKTSIIRINKDNLVSGPTIMPDGIICYELPINSSNRINYSKAIYKPDKVKSLYFIQGLENGFIQLRLSDDTRVNMPIKNIVTHGKSDVLHYSSGYILEQVTIASRKCSLDIYVWYDNNQQIIKFGVPELLGKFLLNHTQDQIPNWRAYLPEDEYNAPKWINGPLKYNTSSEEVGFYFYMKNFQIASFEMQTKYEL